MKKLMMLLTVFLGFTCAFGAGQPARPAPRRPAAAAPAATAAPAAATPAQAVANYVDAVEDRAFRGCDRTASVLDGTENTGGRSTAGVNNIRRGSGGGQR